MISKKLAEAIEYEKREEKKIPQQQRPDIHLSTRIGWMNDPNGFSYYDGKYHLFHQYYPYGPDWGPMHWAHAVSEDMINWKYIDTAMAPDKDYDIIGCFSGSAVETEDGKHLLMYTGVRKVDPDDKKSDDVQTQCIAVGDGVNYEKYELNPVITGDDLPEGASRIDFRDPKIWKEKDGTYRCVVGNRPADGSGQILLFGSDDGFKWQFRSVLKENNSTIGKMWECPDFFELDGKNVLVMSPQDVLVKDIYEPGGNITLAMIGTLDAEEKFIEESNQVLDYGIDFYAPQTTLTPDGRRVMIGWMQNWDTCSVRMEDMKWFGMMSIPREIKIENGKLIQKPIKEIESLHKDLIVYNDIEVSGNAVLDGISGRVLDMEIEVEADESCSKFSILFARNDEFHSEINYYPKESAVEVDRTCSGVRRACLHSRKCKVEDNNGKVKLRIILDKYSAEVFINDGEKVMTMTMYTDLSADGISFECYGKAVVNITKSDM